MDDQPEKENQNDKKELIDDKYKKMELLYSNLKNHLTNKEKEKESEWIKTIKLAEETFEISKCKGNNYFFLDISPIYSKNIYLGTTIFKDGNKSFIPLDNEQVREYMEKNRNSKYFRYNFKNLNEKEIYDICKKGENQEIELKYSPFLLELNEEIFKEKHKKKNYDEIKIEDLSLFYLDYFPILENNTEDFSYVNSDERKLFLNSLKNKTRHGDILSNEPIELYGPFGIGKSTSLLAFQKKNKMNSAYFNLNSIFHLKDNEKRKKMILYESMTLFENFKTFEILKKLIESKSYDSPWDTIKEVINFTNTKVKQTFLIILDQYKDLYIDTKIKSSEKIDSLLNNNASYLKLVKCSSMNDQDVKSNFLQSLNKNNYIYIEKLFQIQKISEKEKLYFGNISLFHYLFLGSKKEFFEFIDEEKETIKTDIKKVIPNSTNLLKVVSDISNIMKSNIYYDKDEIKSKLSDIPLKYILIIKTTIENKVKYSFDYPCLLIRIIFEELVMEELKKLKDTPGIKDLRGIIGGIFEIMCHFAILGNKLDNWDLNSEKLFYLEKNLYNKKENEENWEKNDTDSKKMKNLESFYIRPTSSNSELYDSMIIFKENNKNSALLLQMSISKDKGKKIVSREEHNEPIEKIKKKIKIVYGIEIEKVYFSYIFNYDQIKEDDIIECNRLYVAYFFYSMEQEKFFQLEEGYKSQKKDVKKKKGDSVSQEKKGLFPINKLVLNSLSNMDEIKVNIGFIKSKEELNNDKHLFIQFLNKKREYELTSDILDDMKLIKDLIPRGKGLKLECCKGNDEPLNIILNYLNKEHYLCVLKDDNNKIYSIYNKSTYLYDEHKKQFILVSDNLGTKLLINETKFEYEIFSIIPN